MGVFLNQARDRTSSKEKDDSMKKCALFILLLGVFSSLYSSEKLSDGLYAKMETNKGSILLQLEFEKAPMTVCNFVGLAEGKIQNSAKKVGTPYYDGIIFHRVINDFMVQCGDPQGTGMGGPGYKFQDETRPDLKHSGPGVLSMANSDPQRSKRPFSNTGRTNGSQFFITHKATPWLDGLHTVFGKVIDGMDVVNSIKKGDKIAEMKIVRVGEKAQAFKADGAAFEGHQKAMVAKEEKARLDSSNAQEEKIKKQWPKAIKTSTGLRYVVNKEGTGEEKPTKGAMVKAHYTGKLLDGRIFDSSVQRGEPIEFPIGQVIPGWIEALKGMKKGEKRTLIIPPNLAYGVRGRPPVIPPNSTLVFDIELIDFKL